MNQTKSILPAGRGLALLVLVGILCQPAPSWGKKEDPAAPSGAAEPRADGPAGAAAPQKVKPPKLSKEEKRQSAFRQAMAVTDDEEWRTLQPHLTRVLVLTKQAKDLTDPGEALKMPKPAKTVDGQPAAQPPVYLVALERAIVDVRVAYDNPAAGSVDIQNRLARFRAAREEAQRQTAAELSAARSKLRELLTARQELSAIVAGVLD